MMIFLGLADILAGLFLLSSAYSYEIPQGILIGGAIYLLLKGFLFLKDIGSIFDITAGILLILLSFSIQIPNVFLFLVSALVGIKGVMSLFARF